MSKAASPGPLQRAARRAWRQAARLPWRSGGAGALLIAIMSAFDDSASDSDSGGSDADSSDFGDSSGASSSDDTTDTGGGGRRRKNTMVVQADGTPDPGAITEQDYRDIPGASS